MELYIHLPFCLRKCRYCDFPSWPGCESLMPRYVDALLTEAAALSTQYGRPAIETVFIGGGTPSLLPASLMTKLLMGLREHFRIPAGIEFTSEANPGTLTEDWLSAAADGGVNRLSLGMQAYQPELLRTLGRIHDFSQVRDSVKLARHSGITNLNLDLMFGLPGQSPAMWRETIGRALSLQPEHMSCYGLIPEDGTPLKDDLDAGRLSMPDEDDERRMYDDTLRVLAEYGYEQYEISNFALPGHACRHNLGYWRQVPYIGLGASAASCVPGDASTAYLRLSNPSDLQEYMDMAEHGDWHRRSCVPVSLEEARFETMMLGLRTTQGVSEAAFAAMHGMTMEACYGDRLRSLVQRKLIMWQNGWCRLTRRGMDVQNTILVELMDD
ncbi:MAG: radical SAM family heme chaperone HemW [Christensenellaceae bacterium]|nr:radical SAM family heme chaperone HemW [Christensenellaceae bacterium]